jgi:ketosteroid isomerase-like protein
VERPVKYSITFVGVIIAFALLSIAYAGSDDHAAGKSAVETIRLLEEERNQAILSGDAAALERMTSDDYTFVTLRGEMLAKAEIVRNFRSGAAKYQSREISDLKIRVYGDSAVVTGRAVQKGAENGKDYSGDYWFTRVYVNQGGRWITVALQATLIKK